MTPRSRRSAGEPVQSRTPPPHGLPCWPDRARAAYANADALDDRAYSRAAAAQPLSLADSRELSRHRTDHTAVSSRGRSRRERRRAEQRSSEHHGDNALAREHHASLLFGWLWDNCCAASVPRSLDGDPCGRCEFPERPPLSRPPWPSIPPRSCSGRRVVARRTRATFAIGLWRSASSVPTNSWPRAVLRRCRGGSRRTRCAAPTRR
jgi:hypothetical protein